MTWSGQGSSVVLTATNTVYVRNQAIQQGFPVRYTSYELLCCRSELL